MLSLIKMEGKIRQRDGSTATDIYSFTGSGSISKESANLITSHAMRLGVYSINLGTKIGQKVHTAHMLILPLIPIIITIGQSSSNLYYSFSDSKEISDVQNQVNIDPTILSLILLLHFCIQFTYTFTLFISKVDHVVRLSSLIQRLQEERAAVALNLFINRTSSLDTLNDLQAYVKTPGWDITRFSYRKVTWILRDSKLGNIMWL